MSAVMNELKDFVIVNGELISLTLYDPSEWIELQEEVNVAGEIVYISPRPSITKMPVPRRHFDYIGNAHPDDVAHAVHRKASDRGLFLFNLVKLMNGGCYAP